MAATSSDRPTRWMLGTVIALMGTMTVGVAWAVNAGNDASRAIDIHGARQNGTLERIDQQLDGIETEQAKQRTMIEQLLRHSSRDDE